MNYFLETDSQFIDKVKVVLDLSSYATKKELNDSKGVIDRSNLAAKRDFIPLKAEVKKLGINKLVNVPSGLNNL